MRVGYGAGMRKPRALAQAGRSGLYHVCSRVVDRRVVFFARERRKFLALVKGGAAFAGVDVVSWCLMGNHFHLLVRIPPQDPESLGDEEVLARMEHIYSALRMRSFRAVWESLSDEEARRAYLAPFRARIGSLSEYVKTLKQRFTQWFNARKNREGTLWEGRFHSVMLAHNERDEGGEGLGLLARFVAGYIDLNPVRAKLVGEAGQSDWSGYGAALRGDAEGMAGLRVLWGVGRCGELEDAEVLEVHRGMLERARFRDKCKGSGEGAAHDSGDDSRDVRASRDKPQDDQHDGRDLEAEEDKSWSAGLESRLLSQMGERCLDLTKGRILAGRWVRSRAG